MPENETPQSARFRMLDLIVVVCILLLLLVLALPFVHNTQRGNVRTKCLNNMRLIALGAHNCQDAQGTMPPYHCRAGGGIDPKSFFATPGNDGSVFFFLLPFIEQESLFKASAWPGPKGPAYSVFVTLDSNRPPTQPPTSPFVAQQAVRMYVCPSDPTQDARGIEKYSGLGGCSYACNYLVFGNHDAGDPSSSGHNLANPDNYDPNADPPHIAPTHLPTLPGSFPDGTSTTILFAEKYATCNWFKGGTTTVPQAGGNLWAPGGDNAQYAPAFAMEAPWTEGSFQQQPGFRECNAVYPQTAHRGGMVIAMADASGRIVAPTISLKTWIQVCTPNGGEVVGPDF